MGWISGFLGATLVPKASSIFFLKLANGCAPVSFFPFTKKLGVPRTPNFLA
jgi:hypothetical protein